MKSVFTTVFLLIALLSLSVCYGQYDKYGLVLSGGVNYSQYIGSGEGDNYFTGSKPGFQAELTMNDHQGVEWILWGVAHYQTFNKVEENEVPVEYWIPYYTEFQFYQKVKKNPFFIFVGYDFARMRFPSMEKPDNHHNITFGGGSNIKLANRLFLQFKLKPYFVIGNSIGQWFGFSAMVNMHLGLKE